jgi:Zn-dependent M28 family amino/carboxypeptidase
MISWHYRPNTLSAFSPAGLASFKVRVIADDRQAVDLQEVVDLVDSARLHQNLLEVQGVRHRSTGVLHLEETKDSLESLFGQYGLHPYRHGQAFGSYTCENVIGRRSGTRNDTATWQISGHFDTVNSSPGGDDNGTAVVTVNEAVRVLSQFQTKQSLRFFQFDLEEDGLIGSYQYVLNGIPDWEEPQGLLNMDGVGYYSEAPNSQVMPFGFNILFPNAYNAVAADSFRGNFLTSVTNTASSWLDTTFVSTAANYVPTLKVISLVTSGTGLTTVDLRRSDHAPFWDAGLPAIFFTDGANFRNPNYHTPNDTVGALNMEFYTKNVKAIVATLARLAQLEHSTVAEAGYFEANVPVGFKGGMEIGPKPTMKVLPQPNDGHFKLQLNLPIAGELDLRLFDHHGRELKKLAQGWYEAGNQELAFDLHLHPDHYALILKVGDQTIFHPLVVLH